MLHYPLYTWLLTEPRSAAVQVSITLKARWWEEETGGHSAQRLCWVSGVNAHRRLSLAEHSTHYMFLAIIKTLPSLLARHVLSPLYA